MKAIRFAKRWRWPPHAFGADSMTSLATILGLIPMALALEAGSEQYAPLARAIIGGLTVSVVVTVFLVSAAYLLVHRREDAPTLQRRGIQ